ncbi:hypothetical protein [Vibrio sp.]|uniref:hypothetical protein n=1 Tax=Vibrio sp. TaxID=678 RepID=UPI003AA889D5
MNADPEQEEGVRQSYCETLIADHYGVTLSNAPADTWRKQVISWAWRIKVSMHTGNRANGCDERARRNRSD